MPRAVLNDVVLAEAPRTVRVGGNHYFPPDCVNAAVLTDNRRWTLCPWKGVGRYHDVVIDGITHPESVGGRDARPPSGQHGDPGACRHASGSRRYASRSCQQRPSRGAARLHQPLSPGPGTAGAGDSATPVAEPRQQGVKRKPGRAPSR